MNSTGKLYTTFSLMKKINSEAALTEKFLLKALEENNKVLMRKMHDEIETSNHLLKREIRDEMHSVVNGAVSASERRMMAHMDAVESRLDGKGDAILEAIDEIVLPQIEEIRHDILILKRAVSMA